MAAYFTTESFSAREKITYRLLQTRLIETVNARIKNGEFTERGLAKLLGISQPQMHNVLKGARKLSVDLADRLLSAFGLTIIDLFADEELAEHAARTSASPHLAVKNEQPESHSDSARPARKQPGQESRYLGRRLQAPDKTHPLLAR